MKSAVWRNLLTGENTAWRYLAVRAWPLWCPPEDLLNSLKPLVADLSPAVQFAVWEEILKVDSEKADRDPLAEAYLDGREFRFAKLRDFHQKLAENWRELH